MSRFILFRLLLLFLPAALPAQTLTVRTDQQLQVIDGFGAHQGNAETNAAWWQQLYYDELGASIYRVDLTPRLVAPYSNLSYYSPWFMGSATDHVLNLEDPDNPNGPENNRVRTYTGPQDYGRNFGGYQAPIAVMGPDIDQNLAYFTYPNDGAIAAGLSRKAQLGDFKLIGSFWSPVPWVKVSSGNTYNQNWWPGPVAGTPWPFVWGGNFAGGRLDVSGTPLAVFDDSALGGSGPTSALTQFARSAAAYVRGYQQHFGVPFYAISIQNELNFEEFYNSATYPLSAQYIAALKAVRAEFDKYDDLRPIRLMGPEDLLGGDAYGLWQYGGGANTTHKNLQYLQNLAADPVAAAALDFFCIHGYAQDGVSSAGANPTAWDRWADGWQTSPAAGIPANVKGFTDYGKKSWMTETSGEDPAWLSPATGFPGNGAWSIALKIHQALTNGRQSAWLYWTFTETGDNGGVTNYALSNQSSGVYAPKFNAARHFFKYIRPGARRVSTELVGAPGVQASAYVHDTYGALTLVLINTTATAQTVGVQVPGVQLPAALDTYTSSSGNYWQPGQVQFNGSTWPVPVPGYGVVTLRGSIAPVSGTEDLPEAAGLSELRISPNPGRTKTEIRYRLDRAARIEIQWKNVNGETVLADPAVDQTPGTYSRVVELSGWPAGVYTCAITCGKTRVERKVVVVR